MSAPDPRQTVSELVAERPSRSRVFERFHIDYCCGGRRRLADACGETGVETSRVLDALRESDADAEQAGHDARNWAEAGSAELVDHIVSVHHTWLRRELPRLSGLIDRVVEAHGAKHTELPEVHSTYVALREELEQHMAKEENILFPAIVQAQAGTSPFASFDGPIEVMEHEHASAGQALERLRELTGDYVPPAGACNTYRAMLDGLEELERDLHRHIHEENNILFPRFATGVACSPAVLPCS